MEVEIAVAIFAMRALEPTVFLVKLCYGIIFQMIFAREILERIHIIQLIAPIPHKLYVEQSPLFSAFQLNQYALCINQQRYSGYQVLQLIAVKHLLSTEGGRHKVVSEHGTAHLNMSITGCGYDATSRSLSHKPQATRFGTDSIRFRGICARTSNSGDGLRNWPIRLNTSSNSLRTS